MANREVPFKDGMKVGLGYNRLTGDFTATSAITFPSISAGPGAGQRTTADCVIIRRVETLYKSLGISVDAGGSHMGFSANAKVDYANRCDFSAFSTYALVNVNVRNVVETVDSPAFNSDGEELIVNDLDARFRERFGDGFISGIKTGGEYFAIYQLTSTDIAERESLAIQVQAAFRGGITTAKLNTNITTATASSRSHLEVRVHQFREGTISDVDFLIEDIMAAAKNFPVDVSGKQGFPYSALVQDYNELRSPNDAFNFIDVQNQQDVLADLARKRFEFLELRDDLAYIQKFSDDFENADGSAVDTAEVDKTRVAVIAAINTMQKEASACSKDAARCEFTPFDTAQFDKPVLRKEGVTDVPPGHVRVPSYLGVPIVDLHDAFMALQLAALSQIGLGGILGGPGPPPPPTIDQIIDLPTKQAPDMAGPPLKLDRDLLIFFREHRLLKFAPPIEEITADLAKPAFGKVKPALSDRVVGDQTPTPGSIVPVDTEVVLEFI